jgi:uncharacterized protein YhbP (UPF0306 family)
MPENAKAQPILRFVRMIDAAGVPVVTSRITNRPIQQSVYQLLAENVLCSMASLTAGGRAYINTAYFAYSRDLNVYFISHPNAVHCRNILSNSSMALAIFSSNQTWGNPDRGLQLFGMCKQATGREASRADKLYSKRFTEYTAWKTDLASDTLGRDYQLYRFVTTGLKVFDERKFGAGIFVVARVSRKVDATFRKLKNEEDVTKFP